MSLQVNKLNYKGFCLNNKKMSNLEYKKVREIIN